MSSNRTQSSRTTSPGSVGSSSEEDDESRMTSRRPRDTKIQSKKTKSTKSSCSPARSSSPHRNTEKCSGRNSEQTRGHDEERNHEGTKTGRDAARVGGGGGGGGRDKESTAAVDVATRSRQRAEPKFEPRLIHYKNNPMLGGIKRDTDHYYQHRRKIDRVKPVVDNRPPQFFGHVYCNMKRLTIQRDRQDVIENENQRLLRKLVSAMTTTRVDNWNSSADSSSSDLGQRQRKEKIRIESENRKMKERIENRKATNVSNSNSSSNSGDKAHHHHQPNRSKERSTERRERDVSDRKQPSKMNRKSVECTHLQV